MLRILELVVRIEFEQEGLELVDWRSIELMLVAELVPEVHTLARSVPLVIVMSLIMWQLVTDSLFLVHWLLLWHGNHLCRQRNGRYD